MFATSHVIHTIAAPGAEYKKLLSSSTVQRVDRVYEISKNTRTLSGVIRALQNSFTDSVSVDILNEAVDKMAPHVSGASRPQGTLKETCASITEMMLRHNKDQQKETQNQLHLQIQLGNRSASVREESGAKKTAPKRKELEKEKNKAVVPPRRSARDHPSSKAVAGEARPVEGDESDYEEKGDDERERKENPAEVDLVGVLTKQLTELLAEAADLRKRLLAEDFPESVVSQATEKRRHATDDVASLSPSMMHSLNGLYVNLLTKPVPVDGETVAAEVNTDAQTYLERVSNGSQTSKMTATEKIRKVRQLRARSKWVLTLVYSEKAEVVSLQMHALDRILLEKLSVALKDAVLAATIFNVDKAPVDTYFERAAQRLLEHAAFNKQNTSLEDRAKSSRAPRGVADEEEEPEGNSDEEAAPLKKRKARVQFAALKTICKFGRLCASRSSTCDKEHEHSYTSCRTPQCQDGQCPYVHKWELANPTLCTPPAQKANRGDGRRQTGRQAPSNPSVPSAFTAPNYGVMPNFGMPPNFWTPPPPLGLPAPIPQPPNGIAPFPHLALMPPPPTPPSVAPPAPPHPPQTRDEGCRINYAGRPCTYKPCKYKHGKHQPSKGPCPHRGTHGTCPAFYTKNGFALSHLN